jgi:hypothetical protein
VVVAADVAAKAVRAEVGVFRAAAIVVDAEAVVVAVIDRAWQIAFPEEARSNRAFLNLGKQLSFGTYRDFTIVR